MQTVWKGPLSFGLVNVPVRLVLTTKESRVSFRQLHDADHAPIRYEKKCSVENEAVPREHIVKGVEVEKDIFVPVTEEEIESAEPESSRALVIREFVAASDVDPVFRERSYALAPQPGGERAYALLREALAKRNEVAVGKLAIRNREHLVQVRAGEKLLFVDILHYLEEIRDLREIEGALEREGDISAEEVELADLLIDRLHKDWDPSKYRNEYDEAIRRLVEAKSRGETLKTPVPKAKPKTADLLAALRETLAAEEKRKPKEAEAA